MVRHAVLKGHYELEKTLGCGGFAKVKMAVHCLTGEKVAIKIMEKAHLGDDLPRVQLEMKALKYLSHHHVCKLYQVIETDSHYFMVLEYCAGGELFDHIVQRNRLTEAESRSFFRQIVSAVGYLHSKGYAHRDLKPENVLLDKDQVVKLIDFGLCAKPMGGMDCQLATSCGSPTYAAPELVLGHRYRGAEVDIWSMGVLLYALLCGFLPFDDNNIESLYRKIVSGRYEEPDWLSLESKKLIRSMLQVDAKKRITVDELMCHPWLTCGYGEPVSKESLLNYHERDEDCVRVMAQHFQVSKEEIWSRVNQWKYDHDTALYLLLMSKKRRGLPLRLAASRTQFRTKLVPDGFKMLEKENLLARIAETPTKRPSEDAVRNLCSPEKLYYESKIMADGKENKELGSITPKRRTTKRLRSPGLDDRSPVPAKVAARQIGDAATPSSDRSTHSTPGTLKTFGSRMRQVLTPRRRKVDTPLQPALLNAKGLCNVSSTSCSDAHQVLTELKRALSSKGISCQQKGFTLRGKVEEPVAGGRKVSCKLSFELQVCLLPDMSGAHNSTTVGILRKRLKGDTWCYKRVCEEILALTATSAF